MYCVGPVNGVTGATCFGNYMKRLSIKRISTANNRYSRWLFAIFVIALMSGACTSSTPELTTDDLPEVTSVIQVDTHDTLRAILWQAPTILNPHLTNSRKDLVTARIVYEPLATFNAQGELAPILAAELPTLENGGVAEDGKSVTWKLKQGVQWSDGQPFTADDVAFTFDFITDLNVGATTRRAYGDVIESVEALDDYTVKVNFIQETPTWNLYFSGLQGVILPRHILASYDGSWQVGDFINQGDEGDQALFDLMVGTGPYRPVTARQEEVLFLGTEFRETNRIIYEPNPLYREEGKPYFDRLELKGGSTTNGAARSVLRFNEADFAWNLQVEVEDLENLGVAENGRIITSFGSRVERILLNRTDHSQARPSEERSTLLHPHPFLSDLAVRQAIAHAIDRDTIAELYGETGCPTANILSSLESTCDPNYEAAYPYDLDRAAALLDEAGWIDTDGDGIRDNGNDENKVQLELQFQTGSNAVRQRTQEIVRDALKQIGVSVKIEVIDASVFSQIGPAEMFYADLQEFATSTPNPDPGSNMGRWLCNTIPTPDNNWNGRNFERFCDADYEALYEQSTKEIDPDERDKLFAAMNDVIVKDVVTIPLIHRGSVSAVSNTIEGVDLTPWDSEFWNVQDWRRTN